MTERAADPTPEAMRVAAKLSVTPGVQERIASILDRFRAEVVEAERKRCLQVLDLNNDNDAHRYYIAHPEYFRLRDRP